MPLDLRSRCDRAWLGKGSAEMFVFASAWGPHPVGGAHTCLTCACLCQEDRKITLTTRTSGTTALVGALVLVWRTRDETWHIDTRSDVRVWLGSRSCARRRRWRRRRWW